MIAYNCQMFEEHRLKQNHKIAEIFMPVPNENDVFANSPETHIEFSSSDANTSGQIGVTIGWSTPNDTLDIANTNNDSASRKNRMINRKHQMYQTWYNEHLLDPMDPEISSIVENLENASLPSADKVADTKRPVFRLNEDLTAFCTEEQLNSNQRLNMLCARFRSNLNVKGDRPVPHSAREIEQMADDDFNLIEELGWMDPIDVQRHRGRKYLRNIYRIIGNHVANTIDCLDLQDRLIGDTPPTFR